MKVFISYSRKDQRSLEPLKVCLEPLEREGLIESWYDQRIPPGSDWAREIDHHLVSADIILLLVSPDFIASRYCHEKELAVALYRHERGDACVVPIVLRPVDLERTPFAKLQALPQGAKPVSKWRDRDQAWLDVQRGLRSTVEWLAQKRRLADNIATSARRRALRIAMLRGLRTQLGLRVAREAVRRAPTPELWSELASSIVACPVRPLPSTLPEGARQWVPSPDFGRALLWLLDGRGLVVDLHTGKVTAELEPIDDWPGLSGAQDGGCFSPDGRLIAAIRGRQEISFARAKNHIIPNRERATLGIWDAATGRLCGKAEGVQGSASFSADGRQVLVDHTGDAVLTGMDELTLRSLSSREMTILDRRGARSPDGRAILAVHTEDRNAYILREGKAQVLKGHEHRIIHGAWNPDGTRILTCARDGTARIWSSDGKLQATFRAHTGALTWGDWHPKGDCVATVAEDGSGWIWGTDGQPRCSLPPAERGIRFCEWSPTGRRLLILDDGGGPLFVFDQKGRQLLELYDDLADIVSPCWHPDGVTLYGLGAAGKLGRWSTRQEPLGVLAPDGRVIAAEFMPGGATILAVDAAAGQATLWDVRGERLVSVPVPEAAQVKSVGPSPDGARFLTVSSSEAEGVRLWRRDGRSVGKLQGHAMHQRDAWRAVWSPDGNRILTVSNDGAARLWDADGVPIAVLGDHYYGVPYGAFSPDSRLVLTVCGDDLRVWCAEPPFIPIAAVEATEVGEEETPPRQKSPARFGPYDQDGVLTVRPGGEGKEIERAARLLALWPRIAREKYIGRWPSFSPDGSLILLPSGCAVRVPAGTDEAPTPSAAHLHFALTLSGPDGGRAHDACFSPDGKQIATAHEDAARLWDRTGRLLRELKGHTASVWLVRFSPDGRRLLTVVDGGQVLQLWDVATGRWLATLPGPPDPILHASFSADGRYLLAHAATTIRGFSVVESGYVWIWPADLEGLTALADARAGRALTEDELQLYFDDSPE